MTARNTIRYVFFTVFCLWSFSTSTYAAPITYNYIGEVIGASGIFAAQGPLVNGTFSFDSTLLDSNLSNAIDLYSSESPVSNQASSNVWEVTISMFTLSRTTANNQNLSTTPHHFLEIIDGLNTDSFTLQADRLVASDDFVRLGLVDSVSPTDGIAIGAANLTGDILDTISILDNLDPSLFSFLAGSTWDAFDKDGISEGSVNFRITSITRAVPIPSTLLFFGLGITGFAAWRWREVKFLSSNPRS